MAGKKRAQNNREQRTVVGRPFAKGTSGNPGGRPKEFRDFVELARKKGSPRAFEVLVEEMESDDGDTRIKAALGMLAYAWGKPKQAVELTGKDGGPVEVNDARERLAARLAALLAPQGEGGSAGEPEPSGS